MHKDTEYVKSALHTAFLKLREKGWEAHAKFWCCQTCACAALPDGTINYVFYHDQDNDHLEEGGSTYLAYGGDTKVLIEELVKVGLLIEWDGNLGTRILVSRPVKH